MSGRNLDWLVPGGALAGEIFQDLAHQSTLGETLPAPGDRIGPWTVQSLLGCGGSATVHRAERVVDGVHQTAALKIVRLQPTSFERFRRERQMLAELQHPYIAQFIDAGETDDGRLWFAMELVQGERIDWYARSRGIDLSGRVALVESVCEAVTYAHSRSLIHRDIKPSNILVDDSGRVRLLDFGIAISEKSHPDAHEELLSPAYASPEQLAGATITTASDIYQLGQLLALLVVPYGRPCDSLTMAPSRTALRELKAIIAKASQTQPSVRYATVDAFRTDLKAVRDREPVSVIVSRSYRFSRYAARNAVSLAISAVAVIALAAVVVTATISLKLERDGAQAASGRAEAVSAFLVSLFRVSDPGENRGARITAADLLASGEKRVERELTQQPELRAAFALEISRVYMELGEFRRVTEFLSRLLGDSDAAEPSLGRVQLESELGWALANLDRLTEARVHYQRATNALIRLDVSRTQELEVAKVMNRFGALEVGAGNLDQARLLYGQALRIRERLLPSRDRLIASVVNNLGGVEGALGHYVAARAYFERAWDLFRAELGEQHPRAVMIALNLGEMDYELGNYDSAESATRTGLDTAQAIGYVVYTPRLYGLLAKIRNAQRRPAEALHLTEQADRAFVAIGDAAAPSREPWLRERGLALLGQGRTDEALRVLHELVRILVAAPDLDPVKLAKSRVVLVQAYALAGRGAEAEAMLRESIGALRQRLPIGHPDIVQAGIIHYGLLLAGRRRDEAAELHGVLVKELAAVHDPQVAQQLAMRLAEAGRDYGA